MTLDEHIEALERSIGEQSWSCNTPVGMANMKHDEELLEFLKRLKTLESDMELIKAILQASKYIIPPNDKRMASKLYLDGWRGAIDYAIQIINEGASENGTND